MQTSLIRLASLFALAVVVPRDAGAQTWYDSPQGRVEVLGLRHWTLKALQDSVARFVPGQALHDAACIVTLRDSLGFADASVTELTTETGPPDVHGRRQEQRYLVIKVVEPQSRGQVSWAAARPDSFTAVRPAYAPLLQVVTDSGGSVWVGRLLWPLQFYARDSAGRAFALARGGAAREDALRLWAFLEAHRAPGALRSAVRTMRRDGTWSNRMVAAMVLANFAENDSAWHALVTGLRDPHPSVRQTAEVVLSNMPSRSVSWDAIVSDLRVLLGGTNVGAVEDVIALLARTQIAPHYAGALLRGNAFWVLEHLRAQNPNARRAAENFLRQLNGGRSAGEGAAAWESWIAAL